MDSKKHVFLGLLFIISGAGLAYLGVKFIGIPVVFLKEQFGIIISFNGILFLFVFFLGNYFILSGIYLFVGFDKCVCGYCGRELYFSKIVKKRKCKFCKMEIDKRNQNN